MANTDPIFTNVPNVGCATVSAANTGRDGTGTLVTVFTAGASGSRIDKVVIRGLVSTTAGMVRLFLHDGSNAHLIEEVPVTAITAAAAVAGFGAVIDFNPNASTSVAAGGLVIPTGWTLKASTHNAEAFKVTVLGGNF